MLRWLFQRRHYAIASTRWVIVGCGLTLLFVADLPHTPLYRAIAIAAVVAIATVFLIWLALMLAMIVRPNLPRHRPSDHKAPPAS
jgi:hypothetical protein